MLQRPLIDAQVPMAHLMPFREALQTWFGVEQGAMLLVHNHETFVRMQCSQHCLTREFIDVFP